MRNIYKLILAIIICQLAGLIGSIFTTPSIKTWYVNLNKPFFTPPNWIFAPVWVSLFLLMGISLYLILKEKNIKTVLIFFSIQLILNILWSVIFFGLKTPFYGFIEIIILWVFILLTILRFNKISRTAAYLLIPYIIWVSIASVLNFYIYLLN